MQQTFPDKQKSLWVCISGALYAGYGWLCRDHCCFAYFTLLYFTNSKCIKAHSNACSLG